MNKFRAAFFITAAILTPIAAYVIMRLLFEALPVGQGNDWLSALIQALVIGLGLAGPYWMLKFALLSERERNPQEKVIKIKDMPKDKTDYSGHGAGNA